LGVTKPSTSKFQIDPLATPTTAGTCAGSRRIHAGGAPKASLGISSGLGLGLGLGLRLGLGSIQAIFYRPITLLQLLGLRHRRSQRSISLAIQHPSLLSSPTAEKNVISDSALSATHRCVTSLCMLTATRTQVMCAATTFFDCFHKSRHLRRVASHCCIKPNAPPSTAHKWRTPLLPCPCHSRVPPRWSHARARRRQPPRRKTTLAPHPHRPA